MPLACHRSRPQTPASTGSPAGPQPGLRVHAAPADAAFRACERLHLW